MAIEWGAWEGSGNAMRVGIEVDWEAITHGEGAATATVRYYTQNNFSWGDDQSLNLGGNIGGSISYHNGQGDGVVSLRGTRTYTYTYGNNEYGSSPGSKTFSATVNGAYNGITPSKSVTSKIPERPIAAPAPPGNVSVSRVSDTSQKISWTNKETAGEPWLRVRVQVDGLANDVWNQDVAEAGGNSTGATDSTTSKNQKYRYRARSENGAGNSAWQETGIVFTTPDAPTGASRAQGSGAAQVVSWTNQANYIEYSTEVYRGVTPAGGTTTWTLIATPVSGQTSYTDSAAQVSQATKYRVRHKTTAGVQSTLYSSYSNETTSTPGVTQPPLAPTNASPNNLTVDPTLTQRLSWVFKAALTGDLQTKYQVQHRLSGAAAWTVVGPVTSANQYYDLPANTYADGQKVEWQVRTYGADPSPSPWTAPATFTTAIAPIAEDPVKVPVQMDMSTGLLEANTNAYEERDYVMRYQANVLGGGIRAVNATYEITWSQRFIAICLGNSDKTFPYGHHDIINPYGWSVSAKHIAVTGGISRATLTVTASTVRVRPGEIITVTGVGAPYDGQHVVRSISSNQISFDLPDGTPAAGIVSSAGAVFATIRGHGGAVDTYPSGSNITMPVWSALYYELPFGWGGGERVKKNGVVNVTSRALTSNVATIGIAGGHWFAISDSVEISGVGAPFDGQKVITAVTPTSVSFSQVAANVTTATVTSPTAIARPTGKNTFFGNFHMVSFTQDFIVPSNWVMIAMRNGDASTIEWGWGDAVDPGYDSDSPVFKQAIFTSSTDASTAAGNKPAIRVGPITASHLRIDGNELQSMNTDNAVGAIYMNSGGGNVSLGHAAYNVTLHGEDVTLQNFVTSTSGANVYMGNGGRLFRVSSSKRFKGRIRDLGVDAADLLRLRPRRFKSTLKNDDPDKDFIGFIAEEADEAGLGDWVDRDPDGTIVGFEYDRWTVALQAICVAQQDQIEGLESRIARLEARLEEREG